MIYFFPFNFNTCHRLLADCWSYGKCRDRRSEQLVGFHPGVDLTVAPRFKHRRPPQISFMNSQSSDLYGYGYITCYDSCAHMNMISGPFLYPLNMKLCRRFSTRCIDTTSDLQDLQISKTSTISVRSHGQYQLWTIAFSRNTRPQRVAAKKRGCVWNAPKKGGLLRKQKQNLFPRGFQRGCWFISTWRRSIAFITCLELATT